MKRRVRAEEHALWKAAMHGVRRLVAADPEPPAPASAPDPLAAEKHVPLAPEAVVSAAKPLPALRRFLDSETERRLLRGAARIDARLDLHGLIERDAHEALVQLVEGSAARGHRILLVVTGKGRMGQGILRRNLPLWLEAPRLRRHVAGFRTAFPKDGGEGAVYITLRRSKQVNT